MFKNLKTPHGPNPLAHARNLWLYFVAAAAFTTFAGIGVAANGWLAVVLAALLVGSVSIIVGIGTTAVVRRAFNLIQTGRFVQYAGFAFASFLGYVIAGSVLAGVTVTGALLAGLVTFGIAFGAATLLGEVPWRGRTWLPKARKS